MAFRVSKFEKVSKEQFVEACNNLHINEECAQQMYDVVKLPTRATAGSAGYDFHIPFGVELAPGQTVTFPTGIRCWIDLDWWLMIVPRSGLGFKYKLQLDNTVGVIDSDYYNANNEGHMLVKMTNHSDQYLRLLPGDRVAQGIFVPYGITIDDEATATRTGGHGSTGN